MLSTVMRHESYQDAVIYIAVAHVKTMALDL